MIHYKATDEQRWRNTNGNPCNTSEETLHELRIHVLYDVKLQVQNEFGAGPESPVHSEYSGQMSPYIRPYDFSVRNVTDTTVDLRWSPIIISQGGTVDGYLVCMRDHARLHHDVICPQLLQCDITFWICIYQHILAATMRTLSASFTRNYSPFFCFWLLGIPVDLN